MSISRILYIVNEWLYDHNYAVKIAFFFLSLKLHTNNLPWLVYLLLQWQSTSRGYPFHWLTPPCSRPVLWSEIHRKSPSSQSFYQCPQWWSDTHQGDSTLHGTSCSQISPDFEQSAWEGGGGNELNIFLEIVFADLLQVPDNACSIRASSDTLWGGREGKNFSGFIN